MLFVVLQPTHLNTLKVVVLNQMINPLVLVVVVMLFFVVLILLVVLLVASNLTESLIQTTMGDRSSDGSIARRQLVDG